MTLLADTVIALLAAIGLAAVLYLVVRAAGGKKELCSPVYLILPVSERTKEMEQSVAELQLLRRQYGGAAKAVMLDTGMDDQQHRMARILQREDPLLLIWNEETLLEELRSGR